MRIAFISLMGGLPWGGSETLWSKMAFEAKYQGHEVFVSVYNWGKEMHQVINQLKTNGVKLHLRKKWTGSEAIWSKIRRILVKNISQVTENWKALIEFSPDAVFISQGGNFDLAIHHKELYFILLKKKIPYSFICHSHNQYSEIPDSSIYPFAKDVFTNAQKVYFVSKRQQKLTERKLCTKLENAQFTWNPLNLDKIEYIEWPDKKTTQMAIVGALVSGKGHDTLFEVLSDTKWKEREWVLNIYGKGYGERYLKDLAEWYGIEKQIKFHGHVSSATEIWHHNHILLIPSSGEGLPISMVEAASCGRPAVVTDVGGNSEIIKDGENGFVACAPTVGSFDKALERAWEAKIDWVALGKENNMLIQNILEDKPEIVLLKEILT